MRPAEAIAAYIGTGELPFKQHKVTLVVDGDPTLYTLSNGKTMPMLNPAVVGDLVVWVDQPEPFGLGPFDSV